MSKKEFIIEALKDFRTIGSPLPSQRFLIKKMIVPIKSKEYKCIIELGAGEGCITKEIIKRMPKNCLLISFEIKKSLLNNKKIKNKNLIVINDNAIRLEKYLKKYKINKIDCVISSLPLSQIGKANVARILFIINKHLKNEGIFVQYQYSLYRLNMLKSIFSHVKISFILLNFPPAFVYECKK